MSQDTAITLLELNRRIAAAVTAAPGTRQVWVVAETSDVRSSGGHCYMELIEKNPDTGEALARVRATVWRSAYGRLAEEFRAATGAAFTSGIKVMVRVTAAFHPVYGMSVNIDAINPEYTLGDLLRRRREMIARLTAEGIIDLNRRLAWPQVPQRIAVISAPGAAGFGDFIHQLFTNPRCLRFDASLFPAVMQGQSAAPSVIAALDRIASRMDDFDCVVIIRGGGATGDLVAFDDYALAAHIAQFPLPVIIGIGHERDITLLDYVANMRVKTPTAAAEWLIARGAEALDHVAAVGAEILRLATERIHRARTALAAAAASLPELTRTVIGRQRERTGPLAAQALEQSVRNALSRQRDRLRASAVLVDALSPAATLRRGFSITRLDGRALTDPDQAPPGATLTVTLARGTLSAQKI